MNTEPKPLDVHHSGFVALVGPANAGKSTLLNAILGQKVSIVSPKPQTTRNRIVGVKSLPESQFIFYDTPGFFRERSTKIRFSHSVNGEFGRFLSNIVRDTVSDVDVALLVLDAEELLNLRHELPSLSAVFRSEGVRLPEIIALNKVDVVRKDELLPLVQTLYQEFSDAAGHPVEIVPVSARTGEGLADLERVIASKLPEGPKYFPEDYVTDQTEQFLAAEIVREKLFFQLGQEVPYSTAVSVEKWEVDGKLLRIAALILVERPSQKGIVIGKGGEKLKEVGTAARIELEKIFETKVFLELHVRVEENWTRSEKGMMKAGYES